MLLKTARFRTLADLAREKKQRAGCFNSLLFAMSFALPVCTCAAIAAPSEPPQQPTKQEQRQLPPSTPPQTTKEHKNPKRSDAQHRTTKKAEYEPNYVPPTMEYDEIIDPSKKRTISAMIGSEFALRAERVDRAIQLARRAMQRDPDDMDVHKALAEALDRKLEFQAEKDPKLFGECVREWLIVMRNGVGMEKGTNFRGMGFVDHFFGDDEYYVVAKQRLKHLTGYVPKPWESNEKYLKKVLQPAETSIKGRIIKKSD